MSASLWILDSEITLMSVYNAQIRAERSGAPDEAKLGQPVLCEYDF